MTEGLLLLWLLAHRGVSWAGSIDGVLINVDHLMSLRRAVFLGTPAAAVYMRCMYVVEQEAEIASLRYVAESRASPEASLGLGSASCLP